MSAVISSTPSSPAAESPALSGTSPTTPTSQRRSQILTFPGVASLFVGLKRAQARSSNGGSKAKTTSNNRSPPASPRIGNGKVPTITSTSGERLQTHPALEAPDVISSPKRVALEVNDTFVCADAVDAAKLLRLSRDTLLERAQTLGANVLVDESWTCTIQNPKSRNDNFRAQVHYTAAAARASKEDPRKPIALDQAKSVLGLMTIVSRTH